MASRSRSNGDGSVFFKESHNSWCAQVSTGMKKGKYTRKTIYGKTQLEVREKMNKIKAKVELQAYVAPDKIKLNTWLLEWLDTYKKNNVKKSTYTAYRNYIEHELNPNLGDIPIQKLNSFQIQQYLNGLILRLKSTSIKKIYLVLHASLRQAVIIDLIVKSPCLGVTIPKDKTNPSIPSSAFTLEQQKLIIQYANLSRAKNEILLALYTGMRVGEIISLYVSDIDFKNKTINVNKNCSNYTDFDAEFGSKNKQEISTTKTNSSTRMVPFISAKVEEVLRDQIQVVEDNKRKFGKCYSKNSRLLFANEKGELKSTANVSACFNRLCATINEIKNKNIKPTSKKYVKVFEKHNFHMIRHTFATRCLEAGMNIKVVSKLLGHSKIQLTLDIYSHVLEQFQDEEISKVTDYFKDKELF
jgi:integrase